MELSQGFAYCLLAIMQLHKKRPDKPALDFDSNSMCKLLRQNCGQIIGDLGECIDE